MLPADVIVMESLGRVLLKEKRGIGKGSCAARAGTTDCPRPSKGLKGEDCIILDRL